MVSIALAICIAGIGGLFLLNRDRTVQNSRALWLPVAWFWIAGSRPPSVWLGAGLGITAPGEALDATLEGNSMDALIFGSLLMAGLIVLFCRRREAGACLRANGPIVLYFSYCLASVFWSSYPGPAFKRWTKDLGDLVMVFVVLTDPHPTLAIRRLFSRVGFILLPASVFLIRYSDLGRGYDPDGNPMNIGVATNKNLLGVLAFVLGLGGLWSFLALLRARGEIGGRRRLIAQGTFVAFAMAVLAMANSATAAACFILGCGLIFVTGLRTVRRHPAAVHKIVLIIALAGGLTVFVGAQATVVQALGRDTNLTGRTEIWREVIPMAKNPVIGAGFESFWNEASQTLRNRSEVYTFGNLNSAHNGYLEVYLNLGCVGVCLIALILVSGYMRTVAVFHGDKELGPLLISYIVTSVAYSVTEAGFRVLSPMWICLLLATAAASYHRVRSRRKVVVAPNRQSKGLRSRSPREVVSLSRGHVLAATRQRLPGA